MPSSHPTHRIKSFIRLLCLILGLGSASFSFIVQDSFSAEPTILKPNAFAHHIERFNTMEAETVVNHISNAQSWDWLQRNIPLFECPDRDVEEIYYFRWWSFRKHIKQTPKGFVITEFLLPVSHAGEFNTISCATSLHLAEGRWLHDDRYLNDYTKFWLRSDKGKPAKKFHSFSSWFAAATWDRYLVNADKKFLIKLLPDLVADYRAWETERQLTNGLYWQYDVRDAMEESISGSRTNKNIRPTINSYMFGNAQAIANLARLANKQKIANEFTAKAAALKKLAQENLWDTQAQFFKVRLENGVLSDAREEIGFIPWMFALPDSGKGYEAAWAQLIDSQGFSAPFGITTAERRHPEFRSHGVGTCEWDGAVWPFATSQTLYALANVLRDYPQNIVAPQDYFNNFLTYTRSQRANGQPYIGEYLDEVTGDWINGKNDRSRYYNHSVYADLLITGVIGLRPRADDIVEISPLLPVDTWDWFCLDNVKYRGRMLTVIWDKDGSRYERGAGLRVLVSGNEIARSEKLERITGKLP
ncbi:MAG: trehalase family glycosidase [Verrucomicrobiota bacterium]